MAWEKLKPRFILTAFTIVFLLLTVPNLIFQNLTGDEAVYIAEGDRYLHTPYSFYNNSGSPHLLKTVSALFLYALPLNRDYEPYFQKTNTDVWTVANFTYVQNSQFADIIIPLARAPHLLIGLALGFAIFLFTKRYISTKAAQIALTIYTFHSLVLAHAATANLDLGITAFSFFTIASLYRYFQANPKDRTKWLVITGILLGATQLTKISGILLYPFFLLAPVLFKQINQLKQMLLMIALSLLTIWALYAFQVGPIIMPHDDPAGLESIYGNIPLLKNYKQNITELLKLPIFPAGAYFNNFTYQFTHSFYGHTVYLNGQFTDKGWWYFIPVLFLYKNSLVFLSLILLTIAIVIRKKLFHNPLTIYLTTWLVLLIIWSVGNKLQLGIRYFMPALPIMFVLIAQALDSIRIPKALLASALALYILSNLSVYPNFFTYTNEVLRTQNPVYYLADSDYDWGQSVYKLATIQQKQNLYPLYYEQFGGANLSHYNIQIAGNLTEAFNNRQEGYYAFSHSALVSMKKNNLEIFDYFANQKPTIIIENTVYVYKTSFK